MVFQEEEYRGFSNLDFFRRSPTPIIVGVRRRCVSQIILYPAMRLHPIYCYEAAMYPSSDDLSKNTLYRKKMST